MLTLKRLLPIAAFAFSLTPLAAGATVLDVVNVNAPTINCVFRSTCVIPVTDSVGNFTPPGDNGLGRLQSRTYTGTAPAPLAGKMGYEYRVDMTSVTTPLAVNCVTAIQLTFGTITKTPYPVGGPLKDVFVTTSGGLGSVAIASATRGMGGVIVLNFSGGGVCPGATSYFFGLSSATTMPVPSSATLFYSLGGSAAVPARVP